MSESSPGPLSRWDTREPSTEVSLGVSKGIRAQATGLSHPPPTPQMWRREALTRLGGEGGGGQMSVLMNVCLQVRSLFKKEIAT